MMSLPISGDAIAVILLALAVGSFVKGITGLGLPLIAIPFLASFFGVERAVVIMVIPGIVTNAWLLWAYRRHATAIRSLPTVLLTGTAGMVAGTWILSRVSGHILSLVLAFGLGAYLLILFLNPRFSLSAVATRYVAPAAGFAGGVLQGATGIASPVVATYFHALRLDKWAYVFALTAVFQVFSVIQLVALYNFGLLTQNRLLEGLLALLPVMIVLPLSMRLARVISPRVFDVILITLLSVMELKLIYDGLFGG